MDAQGERLTICRGEGTVSESWISGEGDDMKFFGRVAGEELRR